MNILKFQELNQDQKSRLNIIGNETYTTGHTYFLKNI